MPIKIFKLLCSYFLIIAFPSWGSTFPSLKEESIYLELKNLCAYNDQIIFVGHFYNKAAESVRKEVELSVENWTTRFIKNRELTGVQSMYMHDFLNSDSFITVMKECFPDENQRNRIVFLTLWADVAGQFTGSAQIYASIWTSFKVIRGLGKGLYSTFNRYLTRMNGRKNTISEAQFTHYFSWAATVIPIGALMADRIKQNEPSEHISIELVKLELDRIQKKIKILLAKSNELGQKNENFCVYNDYAYNLGQNYFSILRDMKKKNVDLKLFGNNHEFRRIIRSLKLCEIR